MPKAIIDGEPRCIKANKVIDYKGLPEWCPAPEIDELIASMKCARCGTIEETREPTRYSNGRRMPEGWVMSLQKGADRIICKNCLGKK